MKQAYESGVSIADIAANAGLSYSWARRKLLKAGVDLTPRSPGDSPIPVEQLAKEYRAGDSILTIANRHDLSFRRIRNLLLQQGVKLRLSTKAHKEQTQRSPAPRLGDNDAPGRDEGFLGGPASGMGLAEPVRFGRPKFG